MNGSKEAETSIAELNESVKRLEKLIVSRKPIGCASVFFATLCALVVLKIPSCISDSLNRTFEVFRCSYPAYGEANRTDNGEANKSAHESEIRDW